MSHHSIQFVSKSISGYVPHEGRCQTYSSFSVKTVGMLFNSSRGDYKLNSDLRSLSLRHASRPTSSVCKASPGNNQTNSDSLNQKRHRFSGNRNRHNEDRDGHEDFEESETFRSRNRPLLSVSGNQKFQATATPGAREKEIVELFRKVQAKLRERAAMKEEEKVDLRVKNKQTETVDSLLQILRKHSVQQGKKSTNSGRSKPEHVQSTEETSANISETTIQLLGRSKSNFQKRSPVPEIKFQHHDPNISDTRISQNSLDGTTEGFSLEVEEENKHELNVESDSESFVEPLFSEGNELDETGDETSDIDGSELPDAAEDSNLSAMKLAELRALARSRGMKGFSKLKKVELIELLTECSI